MPLHRVWEYRDIGRLFITVGGESVIIGVLRWGWVEVILRVSLEVILLHLLRHSARRSNRQRPPAASERLRREIGRGGRPRVGDG